jgi:exodeoxyribonuclease-3
VIIATWNINGIASRLEHVITWSRAARPDVLCLQETKTPDAKFPVSKLRLAGYEHIAVHGEKSYNGVAILSRLPLDEVEKGFPKETPEEPKRLISATVAGIRVVNTYFPHGTLIGSEKFRWKIDWIGRLLK